MKRMNSKKGFTLIELLIVIAIIAILAVAFLPTVLGAPSKGRDTGRLANLNSIQRALSYGSLQKSEVPPTSVGDCIEAAIAAPFDATKNATALANMGGKFPLDPSQPSGTSKARGFTSAKSPSGCAADGKYFYKSNPDGNGTYSYGLYAVMENQSASTVKCSDAVSGKMTPYTTGATANDADLCFAILATN